MSGWYRLHRSWQDHAVFRNEAFSRRDAFVWLIEHACYESAKVTAPSGVITLGRGQLSYSLRYLAGAWKWDDAKVRRFLQSLAKANIIDAATEAGQTVISICNYDKYQATDKRPDAAVDADVTQARRSSDANKKEREERKEEEGAQARSATGYAFTGQVVRLSAKDLGEWARTYHGIADIRAELASIDEWFVSQPEEARKAWFHRAKRMLNTAHQRTLGGGLSPGSRSTGVVVPIDDAFQRRLERAQASGAARA